MGRKVLNFAGKRQLKKFLAQNLLVWPDDRDDKDDLVEKWTMEAEYNAAAGHAYVALQPWETIDGKHARLAIKEDGVDEIDFSEPVARLYGSYHWS